VNIKDISLKYLREHFGYVAQEPNLFDLSVWDNIIYGYRGDAVDDDLRVLVDQAVLAADADFITEELPDVTFLISHTSELDLEFYGLVNMKFFIL